MAKQNEDKTFSVENLRPPKLPLAINEQLVSNSHAIWCLIGRICSLTCGAILSRLDYCRDPSFLGPARVILGTKNLTVVLLCTLYFVSDSRVQEYID